MQDFFSHVDLAPRDPILGLTAAFLADPRKDKVNLSVGVYKTEEGKVPILQCVKEAEKLILESEETKNYLPIDGDPIFLDEVASLSLGKELYEKNKNSLSLVQTLGGSGGLRLGGEFLAKYVKTALHISAPSWPNHRGIFTECGLQLFEYPYYDFLQKKVDFEKMKDYLMGLPPQSVVLLHVCCHNPSGCDLSEEEWEIVADICIEKKLIPFFDAAYLGFYRSFVKDAFPLQLFVQKGIEFLATLSFSKNFSLYGERVGAFFFFSNPKTQPYILSQLKILVRRNYSNPPSHGAKIVATILKTPTLKTLWDIELAEMKERICLLKALLVKELSIKRGKKDYSYLAKTKGLFCFYDLSKEQVEKLIKEYGIYMTSDGRLNVVGLNIKNIDRVVNALLQVS